MPQNIETLPEIYGRRFLLGVVYLEELAPKRNLRTNNRNSCLSVRAFGSSLLVK